MDRGHQKPAAVEPVKQLPRIPGGWEFESLVLSGHTVQLTRPRDPDAFLEDPAVIEANRRDDSMPYWSYLWPSSRSMAEFAVDNIFLSGAGRALELGCGIGLVGLALLVRGWNVVFSDSDRLAVELALWNAHQNGFAAAAGCLLDWRDPAELQFETVVANDVLYEPELHEPLIGTLDRLLTRDGVAWIGDPGRAQSVDFLGLAETRGFEWDILEPVENLQVFRLRRRG